MTNRSRFGAFAVTLAACAVTAVAACDTVQRAVDCAQLALEVSASTTRLADAAAQGDPDAFADAAADVDRDLSELRDGAGDTDVAAAADAVAEAVGNIQAGVDSGTPLTEIDLSPLADATGELSQVCTG
jgi:hypothetical protein